MKHMMWIAVLLFATAALAQQRPSEPPPMSTPPTFPSGHTAPDQPKSIPPDVSPDQSAPRYPEQLPPDRGRRLPPDQNTPDAQTEPGTPVAPAAIESQIQQHLDTEPLLKNSDVKVTVDERHVILSGTVDDERQHDLALRVAKSYAGDRQIVDRLKIRG